MRVTADPGEGRAVLERAGSGPSGPTHYITARCPSAPAPLTPRQASAPRADPGDNPLRPPHRVHAALAGRGLNLPARFGGRARGSSPRRSPPPALPSGPPAPAPPAPPPRALPAPRKRGPRRLGPGKGPRRREAARWVRLGGMSARHRPGYSGPREVRTRRGRAGAGRKGDCAPGAGCGAREPARRSCPGRSLPRAAVPLPVPRRRWRLRGPRACCAAGRRARGLGVVELAEGARWLPRSQRRSPHPAPSPSGRLLGLG